MRSNSDTSSKNNPPVNTPEDTPWTEVIRTGTSKTVPPSEAQDAPRTTLTQGSSSSTLHHVRISNSFNKLIPYICLWHLCDKPLSRSFWRGGHGIYGIERRNNDTVVAHVNPISSRQKKRETKMQFSRTRHKGRHRTWLGPWRVVGMCRSRL